MAQAHLNIARCYEYLGDNPSAIQAYLQSLAAQRTLPNVQTSAPLDFALFAINSGFQNVFEAAESALKEFPHDRSPFPQHIYLHNGCLAIFADHRGLKSEAKELARIAMAAAEKKETGLRFHQKLGLVQDKQSRFYSRIKSIASTL
jgi:alkylhydroperoxidase/carboxymuconolactone decarboxylase family protein YurZ